MPLEAKHIGCSHWLTLQPKTAKELVLPSPRRNWNFVASIEGKLTKRLIASG